jgi:magnesium transporter
VPWFVSQLRGLPALDPSGAKLGSVQDLVVALEESGYPPVRGLVVRARKRNVFVPIADLAGFSDDGALLRLSELPTEEYHRRPGEALLEYDVLDRQFIAVASSRVVRVNDAVVREVDGRLHVIGVDVGAKGILRRLVPRALVGDLDAEIVDWADVDLLATAMPEAQLQFRHEKLRALHPSDIARIVDSLASPQASEIMQALDDATVADTLEEIEGDRQADILGVMPVERAADILEKMAPDAAADVLDDMPREKADGLIAQMDDGDAASVRLLLSFPEDSAGGIMTTDFVIALEHETTREAIEYIRQQIEKPDVVYYVYVVDSPDNQRLHGVVSLRDLLLARPDEPLSGYMRRSPRTVRPEERAAEAARVMTEYNLLALPVTDESGRMLGLVTADDALDVLLPESLKRHVPRIFS